MKTNLWLCTRILAFLVLVAAGTSSFAQSYGTITGKVVDAANRSLQMAQVQIIELARGDVADSTGRFKIDRLAPGAYRVHASLIGYEPAEQTARVSSNAVTDIQFRLTEKAIEVSGVEVKAERLWEKGLTRASVVGTEEMQAEEIVTIPGALDDPTRAVQIFSGTTSGGDYHGLLAVRGGSPDQSQVITDGVVLPNPYRFRLSLGGGLSAINPNTIRDLHLHLGGYSAEYGNALSTILEIDSRSGSRDRLHLQGTVNATDMNALTEGPLPGGLGAFIFSARRTYYDLIVNKFAKTENATYPFFSEFSGAVTLEPTSFDRILLSIGRNREGAELVNELASGTGLTEKVTSHTARVTWRRLFGERLQLNTRLAYYKDVTDYRATETDTLLTYDPNSPADTLKYEVNEREFETMDSREVNLVLSETIRYKTGAESWLTGGFSITKIPADMTFSSRGRSFRMARIESPRRVEFDETSRYSAAFLELSTKASEKLEMRLGARYDHSTLIHNGAVSPRMSMWYQLDEQTSIEGAWGVFYQYPNPLSVYTRSIPVDLSQNLDKLSPEKSTHTLFTLRRQFGGNYHTRLQTYYKDIDHIILPIDEYSFLPSNRGRGRAYGFELIVEKKDLGQDFITGLITYSYGNAKYRELDTDEWFRFKYDRRHSLNALAQVRLGRGWHFNSLAQFSSGLPFTNVPGVRNYIKRDDSTVSTEFIVGKRNEASLPKYARLDARLSYRHRHFTFYLDFINVMNRKNIYEIIWSTRFLTNGQQLLSRRELYSLPRLLTLGLRFGI